MQQTHANLLRELTGVSQTFSHLSEKLAEVASDLRASGIPPSQTLLEEMADSRSNFEDLRTRAIELAGLLSASAAKRPEDIGSLKDLKVLLQSLSEAEDRKSADERIKEQALSTLDRILSLVHRDGVLFQPLVECQAKAREFRETVTALSWPDVHPEAVVLAHRRHPFAELLTLVEEYDQLDDDLWLVLKHAVSESFGKRLSLAAARGKLVVSEPNERGESQPLEALPDEEVPLQHVAADKLDSNDRSRAVSPEVGSRAEHQEA